MQSEQEEGLEHYLSPWNDKLHDDLHDVGFDLFSHGEGHTADWIPKPNAADWLPIDEVLNRLADRTRPPKLVCRPSEFGIGKKEYRDTGLFRMARMQLGIAYLSAARQSRDWHPHRIEAAGEFLDGVAKLKRVILEITKLDGMNRIGFSAFAHGMTPEEKHKRFGVSANAEWHLISAIKDLTIMEGWAWEEYEELSPSEGGRPRVGWRHEFVAELAAFWFGITGRRASSSSDSLFAEYVAAAWASSGLEPLDLSWDHTIRTVLSGKSEKTDTDEG